MHYGPVILIVTLINLFLFVALIAYVVYKIRYFENLVSKYETVLNGYIASLGDPSKISSIVQEIEKVIATVTGYVNTIGVDKIKIYFIAFIAWVEKQISKG